MRSNPALPKSINKNFWRPDLVSIGIALFFFAATVKPGYDLEFETITYSGIILILKSYSPFIGAIGLLTLFFSWMRKPRLISFNIIYPAIWLLAFKLALTLRLLTTAQNGLEHAISFICILALYFIVSSRNGTARSEEHYKSIIKGLYYFASIVIVLNTYLLFFEYSTSSWKGRFLGLFQHPNFAGVSFAICASIIIGFNITFKKIGRKGFNSSLSIVLLILSVVLVMASGSRTGILGLIGAGLGYAYVQKYLKTSTILILAFIALIITLSIDSIIEFLEQLIPGIQRMTEAGNTRNEVWVSMWNNFTANPLFGAGSNTQGTAGSYLRVLAQGGLLTGIPLLVCLILCIARSLRNRGCFSFRKAWLPGLLCILTTSITEGYLADALSLGILYFALIVFVLSIREPVRI